MSSHRRRLLAIVVAIAAGLAACGVSADGNPQTIAAEDVPFSLLESDLSPTPTESPDGAGLAATLFLVRTSEDGTFLEAVTREVESQSASSIIATLLETDRDDENPAEAGLTTKIPDGTILLAATLDADTNTLVLNFSENLLTVQGPGQTGLYAQIVCTATGIDGVDRVRFESDGELALALDGASESTSEPLDCNDYPTFRRPAAASGN